MQDYHLGSDAAPHAALGSAHDADAVSSSFPTSVGNPLGFTPLHGHRPLGMEPAWQATRALQGVSSDELREVLRQPAFRRIPPDALVPVSPCLICGDGALRTAGTLQTSLGRLLVRACDTCGLVDLDPRLIACH
jgi:hypothetical protein